MLKSRQTNAGKRFSKIGALFCAFSLLFALTINTSAQKYQFFGTQYSDWTVLTFPAAGGQVTWQILKNDNPTPNNGTIASIPWGQSATDLVPNQGDYTGDGIDDLNIYRNNTGSPANSYLIRNSANGSSTFLNWGVATTDDVGAEGDYDGDGRMDPTVVRTAAANSPFVWYVFRSSDNTFISFTYGSSTTDIALPGADYTGDGRDDPTVVRIAASGLVTWLVGTTSATLVSSVAWGDFDTDFIIPGGDYDGDGRADFMVWRGFGAGTNGVWNLRTSSGNNSYVAFGVPGAAGTRDVALRSGDYDGDGRTDIAVYRNSNKTFYVLRSSGGGQTQQWGAATDGNIPLASFGTF